MEGRPLWARLGGKDEGNRLAVSWRLLAVAAPASAADAAGRGDQEHEVHQEPAGGPAGDGDQLHDLRPRLEGAHGDADHRPLRPEDLRHGGPGGAAPARRARQRRARAPVRPRPRPHAERVAHVSGRTRTWTSTSAASWCSCRATRAPYGGSTNSNTDVAGVYIVDAKDPADLKLITFKQLPTGHTTSCVNDCEWLWTGGPASNAQQRTDLGWAGGRPIIVTDLRDPANPVSYPNDPVDLFRQDGVTAYAHDVDVDDQGVAWVSGLGGMRGYWTDGVHHDPLTGRSRRATPVKPIPYAGGGLGDDAVSDEQPRRLDAQRPAPRAQRPPATARRSVRATSRASSSWAPRSGSTAPPATARASS